MFALILFFVFGIGERVAAQDNTHPARSAVLMVDVTDHWKIFSNPVELIFFKIESPKKFVMQKVIRTRKRAGGCFYADGLEPGTYALVGSYYENTSGKTTNSYTTFYSQSAVRSSIRTVAAGEIVYLGDYDMDVVTGSFGKDQADPMHHYVMQALDARDGDSEIGLRSVRMSFLSVFLGTAWTCRTTTDEEIDAVDGVARKLGDAWKDAIALLLAGLQSRKGLGRQIFRNGAVYTGGFKGRKMHGAGEVRYQNGNWYEAEYAKGKQVRAGTFHFADGSEHAIGTVSGNCENGSGECVFESGDRYAGEFRDGKPEGRGVYRYFHCSDIYEGDFKAGRFHGKGTYTWASGGRYTGEFRDGKFHGRGKRIRSDGSVMDGIWEENEFKGAP